jgi:hypothetical protein
MTGLVGIFLALAAGWLIADRRRLAIGIALPYLAVAVVQTWNLAAGNGVNPPSTVNAFPGAIGYYIAQLIILGFAIGAGDQIRMRRHNSESGALPAEVGRRQLRTALVVNVVLSAVVIGAFKLDRPLLDPGTVATHTGNGSPPVFGVLGTLSTAIVFIVLGAITLWHRRARSTRIAAS